MGFSFRASPDVFKRVFSDVNKTIVDAENDTIKDASAEILRRGRANIAGAGFSARWQKSLQTRVFPAGEKGQKDAAAIIFSTIPYAGVFQEGAVISGQPLLWLPLDTVPRGVGGRPLSPRQAAAKFGGLTSLNRPGRRPLLVAKTRGGGFVPLFVGVERVSIRKRFAVIEVVEDVGGHLAESFEKHLKD